MISTDDPKKEVLELIAYNVRKLRNRLNISQEELGFRSGLHRTYIGLVERAQTNLRANNIMKLAKGLEVKPGVLFDEN